MSFGGVMFSTLGKCLVLCRSSLLISSMQCLSSTFSCSFSHRCPDTFVLIHSGYENNKKTQRYIAVILYKCYRAATTSLQHCEKLSWLGMYIFELLNSGIGNELQVPWCLGLTPVNGQITSRSAVLLICGAGTAGRHGRR